MIIFDTANSLADLKGILELQKQNLKINLTDNAISKQGFVTVHHTLEQLQQLNAIEKHVIAKDGDKIIGYVLAMTPKSQSNIPILIPMFKIFGETYFNGKAITTYNYLVVGQVCIDQMYRGQGIFDRCYNAYKECFKAKYDFAITEIAATNLRSLSAHKRVGFNEIATYTAPDQVEWKIVVWNWNELNHTL